MDIASYSVGFAGFVAGLLVFASVLRWLAVVADIALDRGNADGRGKLARILVATFLGSGFWLLLVAGWISYFVRAEAWAFPLYIGVALALVFQLVVVIWVLRLKREIDKKNAA